MSSTNGTSNPFASDPSDAQASLHKGIGIALAVASGRYYITAALSERP
jgi:hypothetical protein